MKGEFSIFFQVKAMEMEDIVSLGHPRICVLRVFEETLPTTTCPPEEFWSRQKDEFGVHAAGSFNTCGDFNSSSQKGRNTAFLGGCPRIGYCA